MKAYLVENGQPVKRLRPVTGVEGLEGLDFIEFLVDDSEPKVISHEDIKPRSETFYKLIIPVIIIKWGWEQWCEERVLAFESEELRNLIR